MLLGKASKWFPSILKNKSVKLNAKDSKTSKEKQPNRIDKKEARQIRAKVATHEKTLKRLQTKLLETEEILNNPDAYLKDEGPDLQSLLRTQIGLKDQIEELEGEWLEMNTKLGL